MLVAEVCCPLSVVHCPLSIVFVCYPEVRRGDVSVPSAGLGVPNCALKRASRAFWRAPSVLIFYATKLRKINELCKQIGNYFHRKMQFLGGGEVR